MSTFQRLLVAVDLTDRSRHTAVHADDIAQACGAHLSFVHVHPFFPTESGPSLSDRERAALQQALSDLAEEVRPRRPASVVLVDGDPASEIVKRAGEIDADLLVVGSHRRGAIERILSESVTERICAEAACSVLVVPNATEEARLPPPDPAEVICAVDFADTSLDTVGIALGLARATKTHLTLLHVVEPQHSKRAAGSHDRLLELIGEHAHIERHVDVRVALGRADVQIAKAASSHRAAMVIVGGHSTRVLGRTRLGATTRWLLRHAPCPVLLARAATRKPADGVPHEPAHAGRA